MNPQNPTQNSAPWLPWHKRITRERCYLEYWLQNQHHSQWVCVFREISDHSIQFEDYVSRRETTIKSDQPVVYRVTRFQ
jgi:hypothetical protein